MTTLPTETVTTTSLRNNLKEYLDRVADLGQSFQISRNGSPDVVLLSKADLESILETLAILSDQPLVEAIAQSEAEIEAGESQLAEDALAEIREELDRDGVK